VSVFSNRCHPVVSKVSLISKAFKELKCASIFGIESACVSPFSHGHLAVENTTVWKPLCHQTTKMEEHNKKNIFLFKKSSTYFSCNQLMEFVTYATAYLDFVCAGPGGPKIVLLRLLP
jgi:hypothetical protein